MAVRGAFEARIGALFGQHRVDQEPHAAEVEAEGGVAHFGDLHVSVSWLRFEDLWGRGSVPGGP
jgi:hypothetical protein